MASQPPLPEQPLPEPVDPPIPEPTDPSPGRPADPVGPDGQPMPGGDHPDSP